MDIKRVLLFTALAFGLLLPACHHSSSDDAPTTGTVFVPASTVKGYISYEEANALTADDTLPENMGTTMTGDIAVSETTAGIALSCTYVEVQDEGAEDAPFSYTMDLAFDYDDQGYLSSLLFSIEDYSESIQLAYAFSDQGAITRKSVLFAENGGDLGLYEIVTIAAEGDADLIRLYRYSSEDNLTDPDHDVSGDEIYSVCRVYRDDDGNITRQVFYNTADPDLAGNANVTTINLYEYDGEGRLTKMSRHIFGGDFNGDFDSLDSNSASYQLEYRGLYDGNGNLKYWVEIEPKDAICEVMMVTWEQQEFSVTAAGFLGSLHWFDMRPNTGYSTLGLYPLIFMILVV